MMILEWEFEAVALFPDDVIDTLHNIAHSEIHSVGLAEALSQFACRSKELSSIDPLRGALVNKVTEYLTNLQGHIKST